MSKATMEDTDALLVIDVQNDFCPGGALEVPQGDQIIPIVNELTQRFPLVVATKDWHPEGHISFASRHEGHEPNEVIQVDGLEQHLWPDHCIPGTSGAEFHPDLDIREINLILHKGNKPDLDSYSGFFENDQQTPTGLESYLRGLGFTHVYVVGLAEDVCVYFTCMDAARIGFITTLIRDATRPVDIPKGSRDKVLASMQDAGVRFAWSKEFI